jgi:hypothetical protein
MTSYKDYGRSCIFVLVLSMNKKDFFIYLGDKGTARIRFRFRIDKGEIIDLIVQFEVMLSDKWHPVVRYDCSHGFFHRDILSPDRNQEKKVIDVPDLKYALSFARQDIEDRWEWYKEQYLKKF